MKQKSREQRALELARSDLSAFCVMSWPRFQLAEHHRRIIHALEQVERREIDRLCIFMPPRHGKSLLASQLFPAWYLGRHPDRSIIASSYGAELAQDFGRKVRNLVAGRLFSGMFPEAVLSGDSTAAHRFNMLRGGAYFAVGAGGALTGRGADLLLIDDPIKSREIAHSSTERKSLVDWFEATAYPRLEPGGAVVLIQTRWHQDDLAGWLLREHSDEGWTVLNLPAIAEADEGWRREGEPLWPSRFSLGKLERIRRTIGGSAWAALYQQRPAAAEGAIFRREWWQTYTAATLPARFESIVLSLDTAFKAGAANDYSVGLVLGVGKTGYFVLDIWRERAEFPALKRAIEMLALKWKPDALLIEDKASGQSLIQELKAGSRLAVLPIRVDSDKVTRAVAVTPLCEAGKVYLPEDAPWLAEFIEEISSFPAAPHDDQVDALTQALNHARGSSGFETWSNFTRNEQVFAEVQEHGAAAAAARFGLTPEQAQGVYDERIGIADDLIEVYEETRRELQHATNCAKCGQQLGTTTVSCSDGRVRHPDCAR